MWWILLLFVPFANAADSNIYFGFNSSGIYNVLGNPYVATVEGGPGGTGYISTDNIRGPVFNWNANYLNQRIQTNVTCQQSMSICMWLRQQTSVSNQYIYNGRSREFVNPGAFYLMFQAAGTGYPAILQALFDGELDDNSNVGHVYIEVDIPSTWYTQWTHICVTFKQAYNPNTGTIVMYINGAAVATHTVTKYIFPGDDFIDVGSGWNLPFKGAIDDIRFYLSTLNEGQVAGLYSESLMTEAPPTTKAPTTQTPTTQTPTTDTPTTQTPTTDTPTTQTPVTDTPTTQTPTTQTPTTDTPTTQTPTISTPTIAVVSDNKLSIAQIAGISIGAVAAVTLIGVSIYILRMRKRRVIPLLPISAKSTLLSRRQHTRDKKKRGRSRYHDDDDL